MLGRIVLALSVVLALAGDSRAEWWPGKALGRPNPRGCGVSVAHPPFAPPSASYAFPGAIPVDAPSLTAPVTSDYTLVRVCGAEGCRIVRVPVAQSDPVPVAPKSAPIAPTGVRIP